MEKLSERFKRFMSMPQELRNEYRDPKKLPTLMYEYLRNVESNEIVKQNSQLVDNELNMSTSSTSVPNLPTLVGFCAFHCLALGTIRSYVNALVELEARTSDEDYLLDCFLVFDTICNASMLEGGIAGRYNSAITSIILDLKNGSLDRAKESSLRIEVQDKQTEEDLNKIISNL